MAEIAKESAGYVVKEKLWLTSDGRIVHDGDHRAAQLLGVKGTVLSEKAAKRLGLDKGVKVEALEKGEVKPTVVFGPSKSESKKEDPVKSAVVSPEEIEARSTRPQQISKTR